MMVHPNVDIEECQLDYESLEGRSKVSGALRRVIFVSLGLLALVAGAFVLTHRDGLAEGGVLTSFRRRLAGGYSTGADSADEAMQAFINEEWPKVLMAQQRKRQLGSVPVHSGARRLQSVDDDATYIGMDVNIDMFYLVNIFSGLGKLLCSITKSSRCTSIYPLPIYVDKNDVMDMLQGLRDSDSGMDKIKTFDDAALATAHSLVEQGARAARDELDELDDLFDLSTALTSVQIAGNIVGAVLSVTPFAFAGAFLSLAVTTGVELVEKFVTAQEIEDAENSVASSIIDMGDRAANSPVLSYLKDFHEAENKVSIAMGKLYSAGAFPISAGSDQVVLRRFLTGLARATDNMQDMQNLLIDFHNSFRADQSQTFKLWKDIAYSMIKVDQEDVNPYLILQQTLTAGVNDDLFSGFATVLILGGTSSASKAKKWTKQTYGYKAKHTSNVRTARLMKLRAIGENSIAKRKATKYSRMSAGLNIMSAVVQGIGLGFKVAKQNDLIDKLSASINTQRNSLRDYYTTVHETILSVEIPVEAAPSPTPRPTEMLTYMPTMPVNPPSQPANPPSYVGLPGPIHWWAPRVPVVVPMPVAPTPTPRPTPEPTSTPTASELPAAVIPPFFPPNPFWHLQQQPGRR